MKKNKMMRAASALMVAVLLTTSVISGTFAKYVTSGNASDTARVAKFGVVVSTTSEAFKTSYTTDDPLATSITNSVVTSTSEKLVAPGTNGNLITSTITGTPEVAVNVKNEADLTLTGWTIDTGDYCPIIIKIDNIEYKMGAVTNVSEHTYASISEFENAVEAALNTNVNLDPNTNLATTYNHTVNWEWKFDNNGTYQTDEKDTKLGNAATATIAITYTTTVTQID